MLHNAYIYEPAHAAQAVLMIHGICGTPRHFDFLLSAFDQSWAVYNILLDGHGGSVQDFSRTSMETWQAQTRATLDLLSARYDRILVIGHSMGTLLLMEAISHYPKVCGCVLLNVPMYPRLQLKQIPRMQRLSLGKSRLDDPDERLFYQANSITLSKNPFLYLGWIPRYWELLQLCKKSRASFHLSVPTLVYMGDKDELVSPRSITFFRSASNIQLRVLQNTGHFGYSQTAANMILADLSDFLSQLTLSP